MSDSKGKAIKCSKCGNTFICKSQGGCWCNNYKLTLTKLKELQEDYADCLCEQCISLIANSKNT